MGIVAFKNHHALILSVNIRSFSKQLIDMLQEIPSQPTIILLELNMPRLDGRQTLTLLKTDERFKHIPVLIFTTSNSPDDIALTYKLGANSYFTKPASFVGLMEILALISKYWFEQAALPSHELVENFLSATE